MVRYYLPALLWISCIHGTRSRGGDSFRHLPMAGWNRDVSRGRGREQRDMFSEEEDDANEMLQAIQKSRADKDLKPCL